MWQLKQLERLHEIEPELVDLTINRFVAQDAVLWEKLVIGAYLDGEMNIGKAAELLQLHPVELRARFLARGIPIRIGVESQEDIVAEGAAARSIRENVR